MKRFVKKSVAAICSAAMLSGGAYPIAVNAEETALRPEISGSWQETEGGSRKADINISYDSSYSGYGSITALYDVDGNLVSCGLGTLDENGSANYTVNDANAAKAAHYIWNLQTLKPADGAYKTTYADFVKNMASPVPEFNVTQGLGLRNSFETGRFQIFQNGAKNPITMEIKDDVEAHTGTKYAKISGRTAENTTMRTKLTKAEIGDDVTLNVEAFMRKPEYVTENAEFYISVLVPRSSGGTLTVSSTPVAVSDYNWHQVSASVNLSKIENKNNDYVVQLCARSGSEGAYNYIDYYADDFSIVCAEASKTVIYDDIKAGGMKWDFETGNTDDYVTTHRETNSVSDTNRWTRTFNNQTLNVVSTSVAEFCNTKATTGNAEKNKAISTEDADAVKTPPTGSNYMLEVNSPQANYSTTHVTARIKLSKADLVPGKAYNVSFWAFGNTLKRSLYMGLVPHEPNGMPTTFAGNNYTGTNAKGTAFIKNQRAPGIIQYEDTPYADHGTDYLVNYVASMPRSWHKYTATLIPKAEDFETDGGYADLCFVMTYDRINGDAWYDKDILFEEKLYLDDIEITEADTTPGEVAEITNDNLYTKRATFEADSMDMFAPNAKTKSTITDAAAHTGSYSVMYTGRENHWQTLVTSLKGADPSSKITASCWLRNYYPSRSGTEAQFRMLLPKQEDTDPNEFVYSTPVRLDGAIWTKLEAVFDLSEYPKITAENISQVNIDIVTTPEKNSYYADDFMIKADKAGDRTFIDDYTLLNKDGSISDTATTETYQDVDLDTGITSLYTKYADKFKIGGTLSNEVVTSAGSRNIKIYNQLFKKHFNTTASDGYFKMEEILKNPEEPDVYTFDKADQIMKFCYDNGVIDIVGHALIWDKDGTEKYFFDEYNDARYSKDDARDFMKRYIEKVMNHFNGKGNPSEYKVTGYESWDVNTWDVVNEAIQDIDDGILFYKGKGFYHAIGSDYGKYAFKYAHDADPDAELRYNDYGEHSASKADAVCAYVKTLTDPTDSSVTYVNKIGVQSHYDIESNIDTIERSLDKYAAISSDIKLDITELDIKAYTKAQRDAQVPIYENGIPKKVEYKQAKLMRDLFDKYELMSDRIDRVNFWTFSDLYAYPNKEVFTHKEYAGIFDRKFAPKPQYYILVDTPEEFNARYPDYRTYINASN